MLGCVCMQPHVMQTQSCSKYELAQIDSNSGLEVGFPHEQSRFLSMSRLCLPVQQPGTDGRTETLHEGALGHSRVRISPLVLGLFLKGSEEAVRWQVLKISPESPQTLSLPKNRTAAHLPVGVTRGEDGTTRSTCCASWQQLWNVVARHTTEVW